ncbi:MAG: hypothetical protein ISR58_03280 [Anaerolineales bacterium]|nr:hypothetical protein [Chloroflexota bacterium]MBL6980194.1 hypothetical protein [Anaerolineales bacterium]
MKFWIITLMVFALAACSGTVESLEESESPTSEANVEIQTSQTSQPKPTKTPLPPNPLPYLGEAPELTNEVWLNTDAPLRLADLRGKVVLLEMWTFG